MGNIAPISAAYLRERAQKCVRLARECRDRATSLELEALSQDLMAKATEVEELLAELDKPSEKYWL
jgi:hypothetical protein